MSNEDIARKGRVTDVFHFEKYIVPGAFAVAQLFLLPWYLLGGGALETWDLGAVVVLALVLGHLVETLKGYRWLPQVSANFDKFLERMRGRLEEWLQAVNVPQERADPEKALTILYTLIPPAALSTFSWNLVRWQKMVMIAVILILGGLQWLSFAILQGLTLHGLNPFRSDFSVQIFRHGFSWWWSLSFQVLLGVSFILAGQKAHKNALKLQIRTNESYFELLRRYKQPIIDALKEEPPKMSTKAP